MEKSNPTPKPKPRKTSSAEVSLRIEAILKIRIDGAQFHDIRDFANSPPQDWSLSDTQIKRYIQRADELLRERNDRKRSRVIGIHIAKRQALYARAIAAADFRTALAILDSEAKLRGLFPTEKDAPQAADKKPTIVVEGDGGEGK